MDGFRSRAFGDVEDLVHPKIGLGCGSRADIVGLVRLTDVERGSVDVGIDGNGRDAHFAAGAHDAYRNFSAIGDQNLLEHFRSSTSDACVVAP